MPDDQTPPEGEEGGILTPPDTGEEGTDRAPIGDDSGNHVPTPPPGPKKG